MDTRYSDLIFTNIPHGIFTVDENRRIISFNPTAEAITGWKQEEVIGRKCSEIFRTSNCDRHCFLQDSISAGETHRDHEVTIVHRTGNELLVSVSTAALQNDEGKIVGGVEMFRDLRDIQELRRQLSASYKTGDIVSKSPSMAEVRQLISMVARSDSTVLVQGEPGAGKELVARAIHNQSERRDGPFVAVNCGALPETLVESELFGHVRGAFTDARRDRPGRFAQARFGTILLDEIGDVSAAVQVKLLRVLQEREFVPLGSVRSIKSDVRVIAATNRDLTREIMVGRFRGDLYYRLNIVTITLPALRERLEDIPLLTEHFINRFNTAQGRRIEGMTQHAMAALMSHPFPGNVRELENAVEHAFVVSTGRTIQLENLPPAIRSGPISVSLEQAVETPLLDGAESTVIRQALERHNGNRRLTAQDLGISRSTLWRKMKRHGISGRGW